MRTRILNIVIITAIPVFGAGCSKPVSFNSDVMPILASSCLMCHDSGGEGAEKSGFGMQDYDSLMKGTKFGPVVIPGDSASSTLYRVVGHEVDPKIQMPPHHDVSLAKGKGDPLTKGQIEIIKMWIDQGAKNN